MDFCIFTLIMLSIGAVAAGIDYWIDGPGL
jgi:hypothetical protein